MNYATTTNATPAPHNAITGREYTGKNIEILLDTLSPSMAFATFKQWNEAGYKIKSGSKATAISYVNTKEDKENKGKKKTFVRKFGVFSLEQVEKVETETEEGTQEEIEEVKKEEAPASLEGAQVVIHWSESNMVKEGIFSYEVAEKMLAAANAQEIDQPGYAKTKFTLILAEGTQYQEGRIDLGDSLNQDLCTAPLRRHIKRHCEWVLSEKCGYDVSEEQKEFLRFFLNVVK